MNEKEATVKFLLIYKQTAMVTRPEVGTMLGKSVGSIAATCRDNDISGWPDVLPEVKQLRKCCFLVKPLDAVNPRLCSKEKEPDDPEGFLCKEHKGAVYHLLR